MSCQNWMCQSLFGKTGVISWLKIAFLTQEVGYDDNSPLGVHQYK